MAEPEPVSVLPHEEKLPPRVDLLTAALFLVAAVAIIYASWLMPTYREQAGQIYTAPGLVPGLYGIVIALLAFWLGARSVARGAFARKTEVPRAKREGYSNARLALAAALCLVFAVGLVGRVPFWLATAVFVFLFILLFEWKSGVPWSQRARPVASALAVAIVSGWAVYLVFERIFLVRLP